MSKHSVLLKDELCEGCTNCVKNCPTKAIRVHQGKATIKEELCIDCAECIRTCAYHAKYTKTDDLGNIRNYDYPVALIPPSFYGQFDGINPLAVKTGLYQLGFKEVWDVALAAEALTHKTLNFLNNNSGIFISSSCPVVVRLVQSLYSELVSSLIPFKSPVELMAERINTEIIKQNVGEEVPELGIFFITPCPAKLTTVFNPLGAKDSFLSGAIGVDIIYQELLRVLDKEQANSKEIDERNISNNKRNKNVSKNSQGNCIKGETPYLGISWGQDGGEIELLKNNMLNKTLSISGIHNVKKLLEELSRNNIKGIKYFELVACNQGCVGGVLNVKNPFQAKYNLQKLTEKYESFIEQDYNKYRYKLIQGFKTEEVGSLDKDMEKAMEKLVQLEKEIDILPGLDCAACGAPDCETLAEDIVNGKAKRTDCIFLLREQVGDLADRMSQLAHALPPVMKEKNEK